MVGEEKLKKLNPLIANPLIMSRYEENRYADHEDEEVEQTKSQIFANAFPVHYRPPNGFHFEVNDDTVPVQDDPLLFDYNVKDRVNDFIVAAIAQANVTRTNHVMWTMGDDFQYQYAETWFKQMDKLIHYVNLVDIPIQQSYLWYGSSEGDLDPQASGAYIFRPNGSPPVIVSRSVPLKVTPRPLVDEVYQQFKSWISQVIRVYKDKEHAEFEFTIYWSTGKA